MTQNCSLRTYKCEFCNYVSKRNYDLHRHQNAKHIDKIIENKIFTKHGKIVHPNEKIVHHLENICKKCNKTYKTLKSLITKKV